MSDHHSKSVQQVVNGVYENGQIRLLEALDIPDGTSLMIQPMTAEQVITTVLADWIIPTQPDIQLISDEQTERVLNMLRERLDGISLSQAVIDGREER